jgi:hypothetical protein
VDHDVDQAVRACWPTTCPRASWYLPVPPVIAETTFEGTEPKMPAIVIWSAFASEERAFGVNTTCAALRFSSALGLAEQEVQRPGMPAARAVVGREMPRRPQRRVR